MAYGNLTNPFTGLPLGPRVRPTPAGMWPPQIPPSALNAAPQPIPMGTGQPLALHPAPNAVPMGPAQVLPPPPPPPPTPYANFLRPQVSGIPQGVTGTIPRSAYYSPTPTAPITPPPGVGATTADVAGLYSGSAVAPPPPGLPGYTGAGAGAPPPPTPSLSSTLKSRFPGSSPKAQIGMGLAAQLGLLSAQNLLASRDRSSNPAVYDALQGTLQGAQIGMLGGPAAATAAGLVGGSRSLGGSSQQVMSANNLAGMKSEHWDDSLPGSDAQRAGVVDWLQAAPMALIPGPASGGFLAEKLGIPEPGELPVIGGLFGGGGGGEGGMTPEQAAAESQRIQAENAAKYSPEGLTTVMGKLGIDSAMQRDIIGQFNDAVTIAEESPQSFTMQDLVDSGQIADKAGWDELDKQGMLTEVGGEKVLVQTPDMVRQAMYDQIVQSLPGAKLESKAAQKKIADQAALQAALVKMIPMATQPFYDSANTGYASLGAALQHLPANAQGAGAAMMQAQAGGAGAYGDALAMSLANAPAYNQLQADVAASQAYQNQFGPAALQRQYDQMLLGAQASEKFYADYPQYAPADGGGDTLADSLLNGG